MELVNEDLGRVELAPGYGSSVQKREWTTTGAPKLRFLLANSGWEKLHRDTWFPSKSVLICEAPEREVELYRLECTFTLLPQVSESDFRVTLDRPDSDIFWHGPSFENGASDYRHRRIRHGDSIDLAAVARGTESIRWDARSWPPFTLFEALNRIPLGLIAVPCLAIWRRRSRFNKPVIVVQLSRLTLILGAAFVVLLHVAMFLFPGGTLQDPGSPGYSMTRNLLSDLGREFALNASHNVGSALCFSVSLSLASVALLCLAWTLPWQFDSPGARRFSILASCLATIAAWFLFRTGWSPIDKHFEAHQSFAMLGFTTLGVSAFFHAVALALRRGVSKMHAGLWFALCGAVTLYLLLRQLDDGQLSPDFNWLFMQATAQKVVLYSSIACLFVHIRQSLMWGSDQASRTCDLRPAPRGQSTDVGRK